MRINLITHNNGVGLTQDVAVLQKLLRHHYCQFVEIKNPRGISHADVNIFFELLNPALYGYAKFNIFFPNPEWFWFRKELKGIDLVCAKTRDAEQIFRGLGCETIFTSFTSRDMLEPSVTWEYKRRAYIHISGQSETKGTMGTFLTWRKNPQWPTLFFFKTKSPERYMRQPIEANIIPCYTRVDEKTLSMAVNTCLFHVCCSEYEGFGHYIWEAKSAGGIVITTNAAPMHDFVSKADGFLVGVKSTRRQQLGTLHIIDQRDLERVINATMGLTEEQCRAMSAASREAYLANDRYFKTIFTKIIENYEQRI